jgi:hypothetical protein
MIDGPTIPTMSRPTPAAAVMGDQNNASSPETTSQTGRITARLNTSMVVLLSFRDDEATSRIDDPAKKKRRGSSTPPRRIGLRGYFDLDLLGFGFLAQR